MPLSIQKCLLIVTLISSCLVCFTACAGDQQVALAQTDAASLGQDSTWISFISKIQEILLSENVDNENEGIEGRGKRGGIIKKLALPLLLLIGLKAGIAVPLVFGIVALAAFKGLWSGLTALVVTAALALRGLLPPPRIVQLPPPPPPHHAHVTDYYTDYKRADDLSRVDDYRYGGW